MKFLRVTVAAAIILSGCASVGREVSSVQMDTLKKGETTTTQAIASLGQPTSVTRTSDGKQIFTYTFAHAQGRPESFIPIVGIFAGGSDVRSSMVMLTFDKNGILQDYTSTQSATGVGTGLAAGSYTKPDMTLPQETKAP